MGVASLDTSHNCVMTRTKIGTAQGKKCTTWDCVQLLQERGSLDKGMPRVSEKEIN